jgi:outer membrane receptor protein involved in Fe transport
MQIKSRLATVTAISVGLCAAAPGMAQDKGTVQEVIVVGSRIRGTTSVDSPTPVTTLSADDLLATGVVSIGDTLSDLPSLRSTFTSANSSRFIGTAGVNFLDLRGLGTERTLVLVNGRRHVSGIDGSQEVDTNTISADLLQRVEVITGGASSIYGSDAVAGVVNFVTKKNFEGLTVNLQSGLSSRADNENTSASVTWGKNLFEDRGNFAASFEYAREEAIKFNDRRSTRTRSAQVQSAADPGNSNSDGIPDRTLFRDIRFLDSSPGGAFIPIVDLPGDASDDQAGALLRPENDEVRVFGFNRDGSISEFNYGNDLRPFDFQSDGGSGTSGREDGDLTPKIARKSLNLLGTLEFNDALTLFTEAKFVRTDTLSRTTPSFNTLLVGPGTADGIPIQLDNPFLTPQALATINSLVPGATAITLNRDNYDLGVRGEDSDRETSRIVAGVRGNLTANLNYEVSLNYGQTDVETHVLANRFNRNFLLAADAARAADGTIVCRTRLNVALAVVVTGDPVIDNCVPINLLGEGNVSDAARGYINAPTTFDAKVKQQIASGFVSYDTGAWFELPGGPIGVVGGLEYRKEESQATYSDDVTNGLTFLNAIQPVDADYSVKEAFGEVRLPVLRGLPGAEELTFTGSVRIADYTLQNTDTIEAYTGGIQWAPIADVRFRFATSRSVRTPTLGDLFDPLTQDFDFVDDPCDVLNVNQGSTTRAANCAAAGVPVGFVNDPARNATIEIRSGGNSQLIEEEADSKTLGVVLQPRFVPGLAITVDYYDIEISQVISAVPTQQILDNCYDAASLDNIFCGLVFRDAATGLFFQGANPGPIGGAVLQSSVNFAGEKARGIDAEIAYQFELGDIGRFSTRFLGTYVRQRDSFPFLNDPSRPDQQVEELGDPKYSFNFDVGYTRGALTVDYGMRWIESQYIDAIENIRFVGGRAPENPDFAEKQFTGSLMYHDIRVGYQMRDNLKLYVGIDNIGDELPPMGFTGTGGGSSIYSNTGQFFYGGLKWNL